MAECESLSRRVVYKGNPEHKRNPGDFGLTPPSAPRLHATLCDDGGIARLRAAQSLLSAGARAGLISSVSRSGFPVQVWAVNARGVAFEANLENEFQGHYHGYPMLVSDPFRDVVLSMWKPL